MKKFWIIFGLILILIAGILFTAITLYKKHKPEITKYLDEMDCLESNFCKEGIRLKVDQDKWITVNKASCIDNNGKWEDTKKICNFNTFDLSH